MEASKKASEAVRALIYPSARDPEARLAYREKVNDIRGDFAKDLAEEYLPDVADNYSEQIPKAVFAKAWEQGHASGFSDVENHYIDLADLVNLVITETIG